MRKHAVTLAMCGCFVMGLARGADTVQYGAAPAWVQPVVQPRNDETMAQAPAKKELPKYNLQYKLSRGDVLRYISLMQRVDVVVKHGVRYK